MTDLLREYGDYDSFAREWHAGTLAERDVTLAVARERGLIDEQETRQLWRLLGLVGEDGVFVQLPEWLVAEKVAEPREHSPTTFVGRITDETADAIRLADSSPGRRLMQIAHEIHSLQRGLETTSAESERRERLQERLADAYRQFEDREDVPYLDDEWLPKSQLISVVRRTDGDGRSTGGCR